MKKFQKSMGILLLFCMLFAIKNGNSDADILLPYGEIISENTKFG